MTELAFSTATALAAMIRTREISAVELLDYFLARLERLDPVLNAVVVRDPARAREAARAADAAQARGDACGPLHGLPMTVKESFDIAGLPTTWGLPRLAGNIATHDALAVTRLKAAGAVIFGKTNVPPYLADWQSFNAIHGTTNNPWDLTRSPGGSSGGAAAALAAGLTGLEVGSDIGASIRNPAHYCGVYGHKPTFGLCPPRGQALPGVVAETDISVIGPMARSAADLLLCLDVIAGPDAEMAAGYNLALAPPRATELAGFRVAVMTTTPTAEVDDAVQARVEAVADYLAAKGATVSRTARPEIDPDVAHALYIYLLRAATSRRQTDEEFAANSQLAASMAPDDNSYLPAMLRAFVTSHRDWLGANNERHRMRLAWADFFRDWDVLICPAAATPACLHDQSGERHDRVITVNGRPQPVTDQLFWAGWSGMTYLPSTVAPAGFAGGLPVGVQIIGPQFGDRTTIALAALLEEGFQPFVPPPAYA